MPDRSSLGVLSSPHPAQLRTPSPGELTLHIAAAPITTDLLANRYGHKMVGGLRAPLCCA
jgi:hypothetical protein